MQCDTNGDNVPDSREFAGSHRYNTAVALAERFAKDEGSISTVIIASGESQVDAVTAAGLAGNLNAAVMLTRSNMLPHNVARFIDEQNITDVIIVGGTAAVPDAIQTTIEGLGSRPSVERISGPDRYATAAAIGSRLGGPNPTWCGSDQSAAILVNGGEDGRADAVVAGPLAFRLGLPILLTGADELPEATRAFLDDNSVERVVIIGGASAVSDGVEDTLVEDVGVVNTHRIDDGSAAATSVMVAKEMLGNCAAVLQTNKDMVALVNRDAIADGITAAPVLGRGLGDGGPVPILLVGDELPASVSNYLSSTLDSRPGHGKTHLSILAIGGTAVVSNSVMAEAKAAAKTSSALTAEITPLKFPANGAARTAGNTPDTLVHGCAGKANGDYNNQFRVKFSDNVRLADTDVDGDGDIDADDRKGTVEDPTMYRINGRRIGASGAGTVASNEPVGLLDLIFTADRTVTLTLTHCLEGGDTITVDNSLNEAAGGRLGLQGSNPPVGNDLRTLEAASLTLPAVSIPGDRTAPVVEVVAAPGQSTNDFYVLVTEPNLLHTELGNGVASRTNSLTATTNLTRLREFVKIDGRGSRLLRVGAVAQSAIETAPEKAWGRAAVTHRYDFTVEVGTTATDGTVTWTAGPLEWDDVIIVERKTFLDRGGRSNALVRYHVPKVKTNSRPSAGTGYLEVQSVAIGDYDHTQSQARANIAPTASPNDMTITATASGVASGARGNDWRIFGYDDRSTTGNAFDIEVAVDIANQRISYTISDALPLRPFRGPQIGDLAAELVRNPNFAANFSVGYAGGTRPAEGKSATLTATDPAGVPFTGGRTAVGVVVTFNGAVSVLAADGLTLAQGVAPRLSSTITAVATAAPTPADPKAVIVSFRAPDDEVHISYHSDRMAELPTRTGFRVIADSIATGYADASTSLPATQQVATAVTNIREILNSLRPDSRILP